MADESTNRNAFLIQEYYCRRMGAPIYADLCRALAEGLSRESRTGARILDWPGEPTRDALPLRLMGGLHALVLARADSELAQLFSGAECDPAAVAPRLNTIFARHDDALLPWLGGPPQTNEPGRSGALIVGLIEMARRHGPKIELIEIGSSGGLNLMIGRYRFDLGGTVLGPPDAPVTIRPDWQGEPPAPIELDIVRARGCDVKPLDVTDPAVAARLKAYIWPEMPERAERLDAAIRMVRAEGVSIEATDAAPWVEARLAEPQPAGVTRVLVHSVVWQYLPEPSAERIRRAMAGAATRATAERPLGWVAMEPDRAFGEQIVTVKSWPGHGEWQVVATAHAHAAWVKPGDGIDATPGIALAGAARVII